MDCMQYIRLELIKSYKNHKKYDDFEAVVKSIIKRRISDFTKKLACSNRIITENRMYSNDDYTYSIENEAEDVGDTDHYMSRIETMIFIVENDEDFDNEDKEILEIMMRVVKEEGRFSFDHMVAYYEGYESVEEYLENSHVAEPVKLENGNLHTFEPDKERQKKHFFSKLNSFKSKMSRGINRYEYGFYKRRY